MSSVVGGHFLFSAFFAEDAYHGLDVLGAEEGGVAECAWADAFFYAYDFPAIEAVWCGLEQWMSGSHAVAFPLTVVL